MGCGESKHAVATENTLTKSKSNTSIGNISKKDEGVIPQVIKNEEPQLDRGKEKGNAEIMRKEISIDVPIPKEKKQGDVVVVEEKKNEEKAEIMLTKEVQLSQEEQEKLVLHDVPNSILPPVESIAIEGVSDQPESSSPSIQASQPGDKVEENDHLEGKETNSNEEKDDTTTKMMNKGDEPVPDEAVVAKSSVSIGEEKKTSVETEKENDVAAPTADEKPN